MIQDFLKTIQRDPDFAACPRNLESFPPKPAQFGTLEPPLPDIVKQGLAGLGIRQLFSHQTKAIEKIREGKNVALATPTASGKTLAYFLPLIEKLLQEPDKSALVLLFPMKALEQDQKFKAAHWQKALKGSLELIVKKMSRLRATCFSSLSIKGICSMNEGILRRCEFL